MEGTEIEFARFAQNETLGSDWLAFGVLDLFGWDIGGLIWMICVCHCVISGLFIS